ncbi:heme biosynthesis protein HemY [Hyphobacterium sp.]|uniref:heme biosynthesis protein HemY n=1 Tax=Hyphobacterium sp. TaxID=2004662 RepID=UPI003BAAC1D8
MIRLIFVVAAIIAACALTWFLTLNPGSVEIDFLGAQWRMHFALALAVLLLGTFFLFVVVWGIFILWTAPDRFTRFQTRRRKEKGFDALENALIAAAAGEGEVAVRQAARADALLDRPALSRLLAARAAEAAGNLPGAEAHYEAMLEDPKSRLVAQRGLAQIAYGRGAHGEAAEHAKAAFEASRSAGWAFDALFDAQVAQGDWQAALETLSEGEKRRRIPTDQASRRRAVLLTAQAQEKESSEPAEARALAEKAVTASRGFAPAVVLAARLLAPARKHKKAEDMIKAAWLQVPHPALARALGDLRKSDTKAKRAERLRQLVTLRPDHRESKLLLAETALDESQAGAARSALEPLLNMGTPSARLCALAARLARQEDNDAEARRWMTRASHAPGEADWSDIDGDGRAFAYSPEDWKRMVYVYGDEGRLTHPRYERFELAAGAVPENALLEAPKPARKAGESPDFYDAPRPPDDPGVGEDEK